MLILQLAGWLVLSCVLMSFIEHQVHARLMHRRNYFSDRSAKYKRVCEAHVMVHHKHYSKIFSDEPVPVGEDQEIRLTVRKAPMRSLPVTIPLALIWWPGAIVFMGVMTLHHWIWNKIHLQMHKPEERVFKNWSAYKFLAEYHWPERQFLLYPASKVKIDKTNMNAVIADLSFDSQDRAIYLIGRAWLSDPDGRLPAALRERYSSCGGAELRGIKVFCLEKPYAAN